jgi:NADPH2:quinone reductase
MRAAYYEKNGTARDVLSVGEMETPTPGAGEVRVRLATSGVNPSDVKTRMGTTRKIAFPRVIPHSDGAGEIDVVGDGVDKARIGERVWIWNGQWKRPFGTCADYIVVPAAQAVRLPAHVGFEAGACLGIPALTAYHAVEVANAAKGATVLVSGGAGSVGHYAIQFAKARGASVITTVSSPAKAELARAAGADHVIDYKREDVGARVQALTNGRGCDAMIELDLNSNARLIPSVLRPRGICVVYGITGAEPQIPGQYCLSNAITIRFVFVYELTAEERERAITAIGAMLEGSRLINNVALTFPLSEIIPAHEAVEAGKTPGNVVIRL